MAILLVMFCHGYPSLERLWGFPKILFREQAGILGVEIFFALSGYLITTKLLQEEAQTGKVDLFAFYTRRTFRILPAALVLILAASLLSHAGLLPEISAPRIFSTVFFFANYSSAEWSYYLAHFWSLAVEEHYYFIWPVLFFFVMPRTRLKIAIGSAIVVALWRFVSWKFQITMEDPAKYFGRTDIVVDAIMWGSALALLVYRTDMIEFYLAKPLIWMVLVVITAAASLYGAGGWKLKLSQYWFCRVSIPLVIYGTVINPKMAFGKLLDSSLMRSIGRISYSLYLWQQIFLVVPNDSLATGPFRIVQGFPVNFVMTFLFAIASYFLVERPAIRFSRQLFLRRAC